MKTTKHEFLNRWIEQVMDTICVRFADLDDEKVLEYLMKEVNKTLTVPSVYIVNNYRRKIVTTDLLSATDCIYQQDLIMGGAGVLFFPHDLVENPLIGFILDLMALRKQYKKERQKYERGTKEWVDMDNAQLNTKIALNSLYGVTGYAKFLLYNIFLAESVTTMGKNIISVAANGFENFLSDNIKFCEVDELFEYITNIANEYERDYKGKFELSLVCGENYVSPADVTERLLGKCAFSIETSVRHHVEMMVKNADYDLQLMLYFKNNFLEFNRVPNIKAKIMFIISNTPELKVPDIDKLPSEETKNALNDLWKFYDAFVFYNWPIYDKVRKMAYGTRKSVLYIDTDSNFVSLQAWVHQVRDEFFEGHYSQSKDEFMFVCANVATIFLSFVVDRNLKMLATSMQVSPNYRKYLSMKNEFFFKRILFTDVKKRYIDLMLLQEGKLLNDGKGTPEVKGFDFIKAVTKKTVRDFYEGICLNDILMPDTINVQDIMMKIDAFRDELVRSMQAGESQYFKQANIAAPAHYANPYRIQGIKGVLLWNCLAPEYAIELPGDVDIVPIKDLSKKKNKEWLQRQYPEVYDRIDKQIWQNRNPAIAGMTLNVLAKPKNDTIELPYWFKDLVDTDTVVNATLQLFFPIIQSIGPKILRSKGKTMHMSNIIDL